MQMGDRIVLMSASDFVSDITASDSRGTTAFLRCCVSLQIGQIVTRRERPSSGSGTKTEPD
jgi:hypothetical protein